MAMVLIVDDNDRNRKLASDVLGSAGFRTIEAATGAEGIEVADAHLPDVILMDLRLPDMNGAEAVRALKQTDRTAGIPVVAMSALRLEGSGDWVAAAGFAGWIEKPIEIAAFPAQVGRFCAGPSG